MEKYVKGKEIRLVFMRVGIDKLSIIRFYSPVFFITMLLMLTLITGLLLACPSVNNDGNSDCLIRIRFFFHGFRCVSGSLEEVMMFA